MKRPYLLLVLSCMIMVSSCGLLNMRVNEKSLAGLWFFYESEENAGGVLSRSYLNLRADHTFTSFIPEYFDHGNWNYDEEAKKINFTSARPDVIYFKTWQVGVDEFTKGKFKAHLLFAQRLRGVHPVGRGKKEMFLYYPPEEVVLYKDQLQFPADKDPFSYAASNWRIPAMGEESCDQIKQRLMGHMKHICWLAEGYARLNPDEYSYAHSPTPFQLASNGIALAAYDRNSAFYRLFYSSANAEQAYYMTQNLFRLPIGKANETENTGKIWSVYLNQMREQGGRADLCGMLEKEAKEARGKETE